MEDVLNLSISKGNSKLGEIKSVSLPTGETCRGDCECNIKCYAKKIERLRPNVRESYRKNLYLLNTDPEKYWNEVEAAVKLSRFFRFHVAGDIPDAEYLRNMIRVTRDNPHCEVLCFTKKYEMVNEFLSSSGGGFELPPNLHLIFSKWRGLDMPNPYNFPEAHVRYRDGTTTASEEAIECGGNCTECALTNCGCWTLSEGEQIVFNEH